MSALVIRNGHLVDPGAGIAAPKDILLKDGRVAETAGPGKLKATVFSLGPAATRRVQGRRPDFKGLVPTGDFAGERKIPIDDCERDARTSPQAAT